jgi:hypothetical protein
MAKARTKPTDREAPPQVGDKVYPPNSQMLYEISHVHVGGDEVNLHVPGTNLERFRVRTDRFTFAERKPPARTSNPFTSPGPVLTVASCSSASRPSSVKASKQSGDEIDILKAYLKTQRPPKALIAALEDLIVDQHKAWKMAIGKVKKVLGE